MGMSTHVVGIRPRDEKYVDMLTIWAACKKMNVEIPKDVRSYFNDEPPAVGGGVIVELSKKSVSKYSEESRDGLDVDLSNLPPDVKILRFYNSY